MQNKDDGEYHSYSKRYQRLTGLTKAQALKKGNGLTVLENSSTITRWYWTVKLTDTNRVMIRVTRTVFSLPWVERATSGEV